MENCKIRTLYSILNDMKYEAYKKNPKNIENLRKQTETDKNEVYHKTRYLMIKIHYLLPRDF